MAYKRRFNNKSRGRRRRYHPYPGEVQREIPGYPGYAMTNMGRVTSTFYRKHSEKVETFVLSTNNRTTFQMGQTGTKTRRSWSKAFKDVWPELKEPLEFPVDDECPEFQRNETLPGVAQMTRFEDIYVDLETGLVWSLRGYGDPHTLTGSGITLDAKRRGERVYYIDEVPYTFSDLL